MVFPFSRVMLLARISYKKKKVKKWCHLYKNLKETLGNYRKDNQESCKIRWIYYYEFEMIYWKISQNKLVLPLSAEIVGKVFVTIDLPAVKFVDFLGCCWSPIYQTF